MSARFTCFVAIFFSIAFLFACSSGSDTGLIDGDLLETENESETSELDQSDGDIDTVEAEVEAEMEKESEFEYELEDETDSEDEMDNEPESELEEEAELEEDTELKPYEYEIKTINLPHADIIPILPKFAERGFVLYLGIEPKHLDDENFPILLKAAKDQNVKMKIWPLLYYNDGAWCNEDTLEKFWEHVFKVVDFLDTVEHNVETVIISSELGPPKIDKIHEFFANSDWVGLLNLIKENIDRERFAESMAYSAARIEELHARGFQAQGTSYPYILEDKLDNDTDLQDAANVMIDGLDWDHLAFTPYSAAYTADMNKPFGPYFVYYYAKLTFEQYGDKASVALGLIAPGDDRGYKSVSDFAADVAAAKAAGVRSIDVYSLGGMLKDDMFDQWADAFLAEPVIPDEEETTIEFHEDFTFADQALNGMQY